MDFWTILTTVLSWAWTIIVAPTHLFWPFGQIISLAYLVLIIWVVRKYTPARVKQVVAAKTAPVVWTTSMPMRWFIVTWLANPEWIAAAGNGTRTVERRVEVPVKVPMRRSFGEWLSSAFKWTLFGAIVSSAAWNYTAISGWVSLFAPR